MKKKEKKKLSKTAWVYILLRIAVILVMFRQVSQNNISNALLCVFTLITFSLPSILEDNLNIDIPNTLEIIILVFIFSAEILGEINEFYMHFENWDTILHTTNGFIMAGIGYSLVDFFSKSDNIKMQLSPFFISVVAFCFSMTIGILWEFFEYGVDTIFEKDMQKDTIITTINSVTLNEEGKNQVVNLPIESVIINGEDWTNKYGGYIDIGLHDTMEDLFVNFIGALTFAIFGYLDSIGKMRFNIQDFMPKRKKEEHI